MAFIKLLLHILYKKNVYDIIRDKYYERIIAVRNGVNYDRISCDNFYASFNYCDVDWSCCCSD